MRILSFKRNHDGSYALLENGRLEFSVEAEKDSGSRYDYLRTYHVIDALEKAGDLDVLVMSGWNSTNAKDNRWDAGYFGVNNAPIIGEIEIFGKKISTFSSSHERSHIVSGFAMSDLNPGDDFYALVWEGHIGSFYYIDPHFKVTKLGTPLSGPGAKYEFLYHLMDPNQFPREHSFNAGKLMALASFGSQELTDTNSKSIISIIMTEAGFDKSLTKSDHRLRHLANIGFDNIQARHAAEYLSNEIFETFENFAKANVQKKLPLIVTGGCGLNCNWNSNWVKSGLFSRVIVPPVCNDSGSAIGSAADAQQFFTNNAKISWSVYSGNEFSEDDSWKTTFNREPLKIETVTQHLLDGAVVPWVQGRYEIGPRALGHRSLLAEPFKKETLQKLNNLKERESYRPIAPICLTDEANKHFDVISDHRHMLFTTMVKNPDLKAVTHVDGSARLQTIDSTNCKITSDLLSDFGQMSGASVLCNTSLNFCGKGFINSMADLISFVDQHELNMFVVNDFLYLRKPKGK